MLLVVIGLLFGVPVLWSVSVGALARARRARRLGPRVGCQAWVAVPGLGARRYRCCEPLYGESRCRRHEVEHARNPGRDDPGAVLIDEHQAVGQARAQARLGIPLAAVFVVATVWVVVWAAGRVG